MTVTATSHQGASRCSSFTSWEFSVSGMQRLLAGHFYVLHHVLSVRLASGRHGNVGTCQVQTSCTLLLITRCFF